MKEIDKNNNSSVSTLCDTVIKKFDDIIKILNEIKDQAPAEEKREKMKKGCLRKTPTYRSRRSKVQFNSVEETLSTKIVPSILVVSASHKDGSIKSINKNTGFKKLEKKFQIASSFQSSEERSFNDSSPSEEHQFFVSPNSEISLDTAGITANDKNQEVLISNERQATNTKQMVNKSVSTKSLCLIATLIYVNAGDFLSAA